MSIKTTRNYSPNFYQGKRSKNQINFLIIHYTGMKSEKAALNRLTKIQSQVSTHYLIKKDGRIVVIVPDLYVAWHAGASSWKKKKFLNSSSIGIELTNPGHYLNYKSFSKKQINSLIKLSKFLIRKYKINKKNILGHSDIAPDRKMDPGEKFPWKYLAKKNIGIWHNLKKNILIKLRITKCSNYEKKKFLKNLYAIGYSKKPMKYMSKEKYTKFIVKAFQRRFRQELINGKIDKECLLISQNLT